MQKETVKRDTTKKISCSSCQAKEKAEDLDSYSEVKLPDGWDAMWDGWEYSQFLCGWCSCKWVK